MEKKLLSILDKMKEIEYGFVDDYGIIHRKSSKEFFINNYKLQTIEDTLKYKIGTCWEQVELVRYYLESEKIPVDTYIIIYNDDSKIARHTIVVVKDNNKFYWMENSWKQNNNSIEFNNLDDLLNTIVNLFPSMYKIYDFDKSKIEIYKYDKPEVGLSFNEFTEYCRKQTKIDLIYN